MRRRKRKRALTVGRAVVACVRGAVPVTKWGTPSGALGSALGSCCQGKTEHKIYKNMFPRVSITSRELLYRVSEWLHPLYLLGLRCYNIVYQTPVTTQLL